MKSLETQLVTRDWAVLSPMSKPSKTLVQGRWCGPASSSASPLPPPLIRPVENVLFLRGGWGMETKIIYFRRFFFLQWLSYSIDPVTYFIFTE